MHYNQDDISTGERLRGIRENMKMNREEFSEKIDITDSFLGQIERGERSLSIKTLCRIVSFTGNSTDYILFGNIEENSIIQKINRILSRCSNDIIEYFYKIIKVSFECVKSSEKNKIKNKG